MDNTIRLKASPKIDGKIIGFSNSDQIPVYQMLTEKKDRTLHVKPRERAKMWSVGINTLKEENSHYFHIPVDKNVIITSRKAKIIVNGSFALLQIENTAGKTEIRATQSNLRYLSCTSDKGNIFMNNHEIKNGFKEIYSGENIIDANTSRGVIKIHINEQ